MKRELNPSRIKSREEKEISFNSVYPVSMCVCSNGIQLSQIRLSELYSEFCFGFSPVQATINLIKKDENETLPHS